MFERLRGVVTSLNAQPAAVKVVLIVVALALLILLSRVLAGLAALVLLVSLVAVVICLFRRRSLRGWGLVALVSIVVFTGIANAVYGPSEQSAQQQATAPEAAKGSAQGSSSEAAQAETEITDTATEEAATASSEATTEDEDDTQGQYDATVRVARVIDADTVEISPAVDGNDRVRLIGVDTPETRDPGCVEPYGVEAKTFTDSELQGEEVELEFDEEREDRYDRLLAYVHKDGEMFNETLLEEGYAQVYTVPPNDGYEDRFEEAQAEAQAAERGIWTLSAAEQSELADRGNGIGGHGCNEETALTETSPQQPEPEPDVPSVPSNPSPKAPSAPAPSSPSGGVDCSTGARNIPVPPGSKGDGDGLACER